MGVALALALLPVLILGGIYSGISYTQNARLQRDSLEAASLRSAATARARLESAAILLQTLAPGSMGFQCAQRLSDIRGRIPGYENLIRFDSIGRVACSAAGAPADLARRERPWFAALRDGRRTVMVSNAGADYAVAPSLLAAVRSEDASGAFDGALAAVISLDSLRPDAADRSLPADSEVALADAAGHYLSATRAGAFPASINGRLRDIGERGSVMWAASDRDGNDRIYSAARLVGEDIYVVLSAPRQGVFSFAVLNPLSTLVLPLLAFVTALAAVLWVNERGVVRWIQYLQRIAGIYAKGRFNVHPLQAERAPTEFRDLARALDEMAATVAARDDDLKESLTQKDVMMREIHHRVKNNLQVVTSLLNIQQRAMTDPAARTAVSDTRQRITALALIYRNLYQGPDLRRLELRGFLEELVAQILMEGPQGHPVRTEMQADELAIDADRLSSVALFAVEAITNARKHGLGVEGGVLELRFTVREGQAAFSISDSGQGRETPPQVGAGVGRTLMTAFARQLRGEVHFNPNKAGGLTVCLTFPISDTEQSHLDDQPNAKRRNTPVAQTL